MYSVREDSIFKIYKRSNRPIILLKGSFPRVDPGGDKEERFNGFYRRLRAECENALETLSQDIDPEMLMGSYLSLTVSFESKCEKDLFIICRKYEAKMGGNLLVSKTAEDVFSEDLYFGKNRKNIIKQRKIPSRNVKNITKRDKNN